MIEFYQKSNSACGNFRADANRSPYATIVTLAPQPKRRFSFVWRRRRWYFMPMGVMELFSAGIEPSQTWGEEIAARLGWRIVAGIDEVGRGPLAGPVVAAAVSLPPDHGIAGLRDSKKLSPARREELFLKITGCAFFAMALRGNRRIDEINILRATMESMAAAADRLCRRMGRRPDGFLVDGPHSPARYTGSGLDYMPIKHGDTLSENIAAASIVAKVTRDRMMRRFDGVYPGYGFARNKGYGTGEHLSALRELGPCPIHRRSFGGVREG